MNTRIISGLSSIVMLIVIGYSHHLGDRAGYARGHGEMLAARNDAATAQQQRLIEDNEMLSTANAYLAAQLKSAHQILDQRDRQIVTLKQQSQQTESRIHATLRHHTDWSDHRVPDAIADSLRTDADSNRSDTDTSAVPSGAPR